MKYKIIYADPPWRYGGGKGRNSSKWGNSLSAYPCMQTWEIKALSGSIDLMADTNCALFIWGTWPMLPDVMGVIEAWGFEYKTCAFVWKKEYPNGNPYCGMGYWTRSGSEFCLLAFRGRMERISTTVYQVVESPVGRHSAKPPEVRDRIVKLIGDLPRIELFARHRTPGWDAWGNDPAVQPARPQSSGKDGAGKPSDTNENI